MSLFPVERYSTYYETRSDILLNIELTFQAFIDEVENTELIYRLTIMDLASFSCLDFAEYLYKDSNNNLIPSYEK